MKLKNQKVQKDIESGSLVVCLDHKGKPEYFRKGKNGRYYKTSSATSRNYIKRISDKGLVKKMAQTKERLQEQNENYLRKTPLLKRIRKAPGFIRSLWITNSDIPRLKRISYIIGAVIVLLKKPKDYGVR